MIELKKCPFCGNESVEIGNCMQLEECAHFEECPAEQPFVCVVCGMDKGGCGASSGYYDSEEKAIAAWNRRAQPENSRQHALQTGVCPMCEDCPDGCPVETPNDSRNRPENDPLTLDELRQMDGEPLKHWVWIEILLPETWPYEMDSGYYRNILDHTGGEAFCYGYPGWSAGLPYDDYGKTWLAYRAKPERSEG